MFERPQHQRISHVLAALNGAVLAQHQFWYSGGTCIALRYGEYRESVDIDFFSLRLRRLPRATPIAL